MTASTHATKFAQGLTEKFQEEGPFSSKYFTVRAGKRYDRIMAGQSPDRATHVHAFVERETGGVFKPAGLAKPAQGLRYASVEAAIEAADLHGSYLYIR